MPNRFSNLFPAWDLFEQIQKEACQLERATSPRDFMSVELFSDDEYAYATLAVPGVKTDDIDVSLEGDRLMVKTSRSSNADSSSDTKWLRRERDDAGNDVTIVLPFDADPGGVEAELDHGMLWIRAPRAESTRPTRIPVQPAAR